MRRVASSKRPRRFWEPLHGEQDYFPPARNDSAYFHSASEMADAER